MKYLTRKQANAYLREKGVTCGDFLLAHLAMTGEGPQFRYWGRRPLYAEKDLDDWIASKLSSPVRSRSEATALLKQEKDLPLSPPTRTARQYSRRPGRPRKQPTAPAPPI
jgi:hypothetical protein